MEALSTGGKVAGWVRIRPASVVRTTPDCEWQAATVNPRSAKMRAEGEIRRAKGKDMG